MSTRLSTPANVDIYQRVTDSIIRNREQGTRPWIKPWTTATGTTTPIRPLRHDGTPYRGINVLILWSEATERGYGSSTWMTYRQANILGAQVRKGERGTTVVYAKTIERAEDDPATGDETVTRIPLPRLHRLQHRPDRRAAGIGTGVIPSERTCIGPDRPRRCLRQRERREHRSQRKPRLLHPLR